MYYKENVKTCHGHYLLIFFKFARENLLPLGNNATWGRYTPTLGSKKLLQGGPTQTLLPAVERHGCMTQVRM